MILSKKSQKMLLRRNNQENFCIFYKPLKYISKKLPVSSNLSIAEL